MKSGLGDRNNQGISGSSNSEPPCLNKVRSWRPEQYTAAAGQPLGDQLVSIKSGLGDRNNLAAPGAVLVTSKSQ